MQIKKEMSRIQEDTFHSQETKYSGLPVNVTGSTSLHAARLSIEIFKKPFFSRKYFISNYMFGLCGHRQALPLPYGESTSVSTKRKKEHLVMAT
jgi:hypothetical protein